MVIRRGFACYGYGYHEEEKDARRREGKKNQEEKKLMIKFMNQSINQSMELEVGSYLVGTSVVVVLSASRCLFLLFKNKIKNKRKEKENNK